MPAEPTAPIEEHLPPTGKADEPRNDRHGTVDGIDRPSQNGAPWHEVPWQLVPPGFGNWSVPESVGHGRFPGRVPTDPR
jgi:hypothetical protein